MNSILMRPLPPAFLRFIAYAFPACALLSCALLPGPGGDRAGRIPHWPREARLLLLPDSAVLVLPESLPESLSAAAESRRAGEEPPGGTEGAQRGERKYPLLLFLHGWTQNHAPREALPGALWARQNGFLFLSPAFGGPFHRGGILSEAQEAAVLAARLWAIRNLPVDTARIFLVGLSGGGLLALHLAHRHPALFRGVSVQAAITDLAAWHAELAGKPWRYRRDLEDVFGPPAVPPPAPPAGQDSAHSADSASAENPYRRNSPLHRYGPYPPLLGLDLQVGLLDGRSGPVPPSHSLLFFNRICAERGGNAALFLPDEVAAMDRKHRLPPSVPVHRGRHPYRRTRLLHRRSCDGAQISILRSGHEMHWEGSLEWLRAEAARSP